MKYVTSSPLAITESSAIVGNTTVIGSRQFVKDVKSAIVLNGCRTLADKAQALAIALGGSFNGTEANPTVTITAAIASRKTIKLRKKPKAHKRHKVVVKAQRATQALFNHSRVEKAQRVFEKAVQKTARKLKVTFKEVLEMDLMSVFTTKGEVRPVFHDLANAYYTVRALMA